MVTKFDSSKGSTAKKVENHWFIEILYAFQTLRKQIMGKFRSEKDKMPLDKKAMVLTQFPRFLTILEEELFATNSPIWDPDFRQVR